MGHRLVNFSPSARAHRRKGCIHRTAAARATAELVERGLIVCIHRGDLAS